MPSQSVLQVERKSLRLDFFPHRPEAVLTKVSHTKLVAIEAKMARFTSHRDIRFYVQCDC
jgi:hypothetical protein